MRRPSPRLVSLLPVTALLFGLGAAVPVHARADGVGDRQKQVASALKAASADLDDASDATTQAAAQLTAVEGQLTSAQATLDADRQQLTGARATVLAAEQATAAAQGRLSVARAQQEVATQAVEAQQLTIDDYVSAAYRTGATPTTLIVVAAGSGADNFLQSAGLLDQAARGESRQLGVFDRARAEVAAATQVVAAQTAAVAAHQQEAQEALGRVSALVSSAAAQASRLTALTRQRNAVLAGAESALASQRSRVASLTQESNRIAALIRARASTTTRPIGREGLVWPISGTIEITSPFGYRLDPVTHVYQLHAGIDLRAADGTPVHAAKAGTVIYAGAAGGYGNYICIDHGGGFSTCYAHQSSIGVSVGQHVSQGQLIGLSGQTGYATGPHLHFETRVNGAPQNPLLYI